MYFNYTNNYSLKLEKLDFILQLVKEVNSFKAKLHFLADFAQFVENNLNIGKSLIEKFLFFLYNLHYINIYIIF